PITRARQAIAAPVAVTVTLFHISVLAFIPLDPWIFLGFSAHLFCILAFISFPIVPALPRLSVVLDALLCFASAAVMLYLWINVREMYYRVGFNPTFGDVVAGTAALLL